jgi:hypothetical protein
MDSCGYGGTHIIREFRCVCVSEAFCLGVCVDAVNVAILP